MNPYLETIWHDFHERYIPAAAAFLTPQVRPKSFVTIDDSFYLQELTTRNAFRLARPDLTLVRGEGVAPGGSTAAILEAPSHVLLPESDIENLSYLRIVDRQSRHVVTVIELSSPANKNLGANRLHYLAKRAAIRESDAHFIEIDLLLSGLPAPVTGRPECLYSVLVSRVERRPSAEFWPFGSRDRISTIPVPLGRDDKDAILDFRAVLDRVYDESAYEDYLYLGEHNLRLSIADSAWTRSFTRKNEGGIDPPSWRRWNNFISISNKFM